MIVDDSFSEFLPANARCRAIAEGWPEITRALQAQGLTVLPVPAHPALPEPIRCHADLQLFPLHGKRVLVVQDAPVLSQRLAQLGWTVIPCAKPLGGTYPQDVLLCGFVLRGKLYGLPQAMAEELMAAYPEVIPVKQGYARCSTCLVDANSVITADEGIACAAERQGLAVLRIHPGHIDLPGYAYGFIGGCAGWIAPHTLAFTGELAAHPDGEAIRSFCEARGVAVVCLCPGPLRDIGGILPLWQEE